MFLKFGIFLMSLVAIVQGTNRIVGGHDAPNHGYPYQISIRDMRGTHFCGGAIINQRWILSAAHCFERNEGKNFIMVAGTNFLNKKGPVYWPQLTVIHEKYTNFKNYDIALIRTKSEIVFQDFVAPIALPVDDLRDYGKIAVFTGWGSTWNKTGDYPNALQEIELNLVTLERCKKVHSITDDHLCSLNKLGEGLCYADSGGPLVVDDQVVGIASYTTPCAENIPDVFTRVWSYKNWIDFTVKKNDK